MDRKIEFFESRQNIKSINEFYKLKYKKDQYYSFFLI
jgi:hypothetical protein